MSVVNWDRVFGRYDYINEQKDNRLLVFDRTATNSADSVRAFILDPKTDPPGHISRILGKEIEVEGNSVLSMLYTTEQETVIDDLILGNRKFTFTPSLPGSIDPIGRLIISAHSESLE
ncbi:MAG: hypothetical protein K1060chlam3_00263 [Candidatus Anoxychlamydiales bacterium]|nr:hypothetical protein [Candidatus Anoxychlamydiales bacterium]